MSIKARAGNMLVIGLEEGNIERLKAGNPFTTTLKECGFDHDVTLFVVYGKTEADLIAMFKDHIGPETDVRDDRKRSKN